MNSDEHGADNDSCDGSREAVKMLMVDGLQEKDMLCAISGQSEMDNVIIKTEDTSMDPDVEAVSSLELTEEGGQDKQFLIVSSSGNSFGVGTLELLPDEADDGEPALKRYRMQAEDGQAYILTVAATGEDQPSTLLAAEHQYQAKEPNEDFTPEMLPGMGGSTKMESGRMKRGQVPKDDVSQSWFTSRDDKNSLHNSGATWKQGQWSKDEVEILQANIAMYCKEHNISDPTVIIFEMSKDDRKQFYRTIAKGLQRPLFSVYRRVTRMYDQKNHMGKYTNEEMMKLRELRMKHANDWASIGQALGRSASSVKDKCRLMRDMCNSGKWLPEEEKRLTQSVYELAGGQPGEDIVHGLSWACIAERVVTRSEKQCRTKWLNYMNWKMKGGKEWTREDDMELIIRVSNLGIDDDSDIDWDTLAKDWQSARSPQWLRGKWWSLKKNIPDYNIIPFNELLNSMKTFYLLNVRVRNALGTARTRKLETQPGDSLAFRISTLSGEESLSLEEGDGLDEVEAGTSAYEVLQQLPPASSASYIIAQPSDTSPQSTLGEQIIVHTLPICQMPDGDLGLQPRLVIRVPSASDLSDPGVTLDQTDISTPIQIPENIDTSQQGLEGLSEEGVISRSDSLTDDPSFSTHTLEESVISSPGGMSLKQARYTRPNNGQLMTSFADPMLNSDSNSLMGAVSDVEGDKSHPDDIIVNI
ncbi:cyclin-D-binding Myb-like transcription factor 1 [Mya arenaria]|uniref:cyclin-D-binding Myb-like transcription factor 1 n=1 Tax=Mya arenaria TaxID=6604 RepID=UPI0022E028A6|nr:cyclin-D-binding Myb-like transcription factor 1 [Mya arenaria]